MNKEITVMLPIQVPDCIWCYHKEQKVCCQYFRNDYYFVNCSLGFDPVKVITGVYEKPKDCRNLIFKENIK